MKYLILGDIHGRLIWEDIINKENPDVTIFLGDYVTTHGLISAEQQLSNLEDILNYKEDNLNKVILLRGNHDTQMLGYYWAKCSRWDQKVYKGMIPMKERFLSLTQWIYRIPDTNIVCSHAGLSTSFLKNVERYLTSHRDSQYDGSIDTGVVIDLINSIEPCELFGFTPCKMSDYCGTSATQPCTWIRPEALLEYGVKEIIHVVGHTPVKRLCNITTKYKKCSDVSKDANYPNIWLCDTLGLNNPEYLVIENKEFQVKAIKD